MTELPRTIEAVDGAWLTAALRRSGLIDAEGTVSVGSAEPLTTGTAFSTIMYRLTLEGPTGTPDSAVVKLPVAGQVRQLLDGIGAYRREVTFYSELADHVPIRVPKPYIAEIAEGSTDFVLAIEDLSHLEPANQMQGLTLEQAQTAVDNLARFHAHFWESERLAQLADRFPPLDGEQADAIYAQFTQFFAMAWQSARELPVVADEVKRFGDRYGELLPFMVEQLATPRTIVHGELRAENLFLTRDGGLLMIDFQTVAQHAGVVDVAYLVAGSLTPDVRRGRDQELVRRYHAGLQDAGVTGYSFDRAWEQYRIALPFNLLLSGLAFMQYEVTDDKGKELLVEMLRRASDAIVANRSLELI
jgi:Ecdysteroid kinase-like family